MKMQFVRRRMGTTTSWAVLGLALAISGPAFAQTGQNTGTSPSAGDQDAAPTVSGDPADLQTGDAIVVVGTRQSQQSAIDRKRNARTATDSIVADDIGSFPDRNVNEAISRVPGVALSRNDFGEGDGVSLRGNGPALTRVELDGAGVQRSDPSIDTARGADMRELPAELVKSIDVVKGATADQTEGGLGGSILIKTRSGLDFKKPYFSIRGGAQMGSLSQKWTPDFNAVATKKFFDDRLGVIVSGTYSRVQNTSSTFENQTTNQSGFSRVYDLDNSPNKTFQFNPATVGTDAADVALANSRQESDGSTLTPRELITMSAGAQSKAQCMTLFPTLAAPFGNGVGTNQTAINNRNAQITQRVREQQTCLNQWNDMYPSLIRHINQLNDEKRYSVDARLDYRVTDNLTVYVKAQVNGRNVDEQIRQRSPVSLPAASTNATYFTDAGTPLIRNNRTPTAAGTAAGYSVFDPTFGVFPVTAGSGTSTTVTPTYGNLLNIAPGSLKIDANHNVTSMTLTNSSVSYDQVSNAIDSKSRYYMAGLEWRFDRLLVEAFGTTTSTSGSRNDLRTTRSAFVGNATLTVQPDGLYTSDFGNFDEYNAASFVTLNPATATRAVIAPSATNPVGDPNSYTIAQQPLTTGSFSAAYSPRIGETTEKQAKIDLTYDTDDLLPFIKRVKVGAMYRRNEQYQWTGGGRVVSAAKGTFGQNNPLLPNFYVPAVQTPRALLRTTYRACQPTATSTLSCNYGYVPSTDPALALEGVYTFTPQELQALYAKSLQPQESEWFRDLPNRGNLPGTWPEVDVKAFFKAMNLPNFNYDCVKTCTGTDGKTYNQPFSGADETIKNVYGMFDFEQRLPLGLLFNGNIGVRGVFAKTIGSGIQNIVVVQPTATFDPANPTAAGGTISQSLNLDVSVNKSTTDWLPTANFNLWAFDESIVLRAYGGKTVARPTVSNLVPGGTCTINQNDFNAAGDDIFGCTGRVGNPGLKPFTAWNYNIALEWYANADTLFSVAYGKLDVKIGAPEAVTITSQPFAGSTATDPVTGASLADLTFSVPTWRNGPGYKRNIWEFNIKHAFTYLPWFLKNLGTDANVSLLSSSAVAGGAIRDPNTGIALPPAGESRYYLNGSIWYDDGKLNLRATMQKRSESFNCIAPCGGNVVSFNYPGNGYTNVAIGTQGYNPGVPKITEGTTYIDAKASYNITRNFQVYLEGRNMTREAQLEDQGQFERFESGAPKVMRLRYGGRRILAGVRAQFGN